MLKCLCTIFFFVRRVSSLPPVLGTSPRPRWPPPCATGGGAAQRRPRPPPRPGQPVRGRRAAVVRGGQPQRRAVARPGRPLGVADLTLVGSRRKVFDHLGGGPQCPPWSIRTSLKLLQNTPIYAVLRPVLFLGFPNRNGGASWGWHTIFVLTQPLFGKLKNKWDISFAEKFRRWESVQTANLHFSEVASYRGGVELVRPPPLLLLMKGQELSNLPVICGLGTSWPM